MYFLHNGHFDEIRDMVELQGQNLLSYWSGALSIGSPLKIDIVLTFIEIIYFIMMICKQHLLPINTKKKKNKYLN